MQDCLFCKMAAGEIPVNKVYEDDTVLAFHDIDPQAPVHFVIPKVHIPSPAAVTPENSAVVAHIRGDRDAGRGAGLENGYRQDKLRQGRRTERAAPALSHVLAKRSLAWPPG